MRRDRPRGKKIGKDGVRFIIKEGYKFFYVEERLDHDIINVKNHIKSKKLDLKADSMKYFKHNNPRNDKVTLKKKKITLSH